ncbi:MAG: AI-2E family transporter [Clostridia bacterium]|nr:AI-2E family transporter [Clostridia bacterium]
MEKIKKFFAKPVAGYTGAACIAVVLYEILEHFSAVKAAFSGVWNFIFPVVVGIIIAYLFDPIADDLFEKKILKNVKKDSARHTLGVILTIVLIVIILALLLLALIPSLVKSISKLVSNWSDYTQKLDGLIRKLAAFAANHRINIDVTKIENTIDNSMAKIVDMLKNNSKTILGKVGEIGSGITSFFVGVIFGFCFLAAKSTLLGFLNQIRSALYTKERLEKNNVLWRRCHKIFIRYVGCTLFDALVVGITTLIFTLITNTPYAALISVVVAITNIIPTFGPMIGAAIGIFFIILESPVKALVFLIFICILQAIDGMLIKPKLFKGSLGIPAVWTLVLIILGGKIAGMLGIILAIPFAAIFVIIYRETIAPKLEKRAEKLNGPKEEEVTEIAEKPE